MKMPPQGCNRYKVLEVVYRFGEIKSAAVCLYLPNMLKESVHKAMSDGVSGGQMTREGYTYSLTPAAKRYFDDLKGASPFKPQIAEPRRVNAFTPEMRGYEAALRQCVRQA